MKKQLSIILLFLFSILVACASVESTPPSALVEVDVLNAAVDAARTEVALTQAALSTPTPTIVILTPSPYPTQTSFPVKITPDVSQVERWREYQTALAHSMIHEDSAKYALCEWEILGRDEQEVYLWATCATRGIQASRAAVIYLQADGSVQDVKAPFSVWDSEVQELFPENVRKVIHSYGQITGPQKMLDHIYLRQNLPEALPLIILSGRSPASFIITPVLTSTSMP